MGHNGFDDLEFERHQLHTAVDEIAGEAMTPAHARTWGSVDAH